MRSPADLRALRRFTAAALALLAIPSPAQEPPLRTAVETPDGAQTLADPSPPTAVRRPPAAPRGDAADLRGDTADLRRLLRQLREEYPAEFRELEKLRGGRDPEFRARLRRVLVADRVMTWLKAIDPASHRELRQLRRSDPDRYFRRIAELGDRSGSRRPPPPLPGTALHVPAGRIDELRRAYREAGDPEERERLRREAQQILVRQFAARRRAAEERLRRIRAETEQLEKRLENWGRNRDRVIRAQMSILFPETE